MNKKMRIILSLISVLACCGLPSAGYAQTIDQSSVTALGKNTHTFAWELYAQLREKRKAI